MCIENSHNRCGGCALSLEYMQSLKDWAAELVRSHPLSHAHPYIGVIPLLTASWLALGAICTHVHLCL